MRDKGLFLKKPRFDADYLRHINQNLSLVPEIEEQPRMLLVGLRTLFFGVDSEKNNVGAQLPPLGGAFIPRLAEIEHRVPGVCYGVVRQLDEGSERLEYHAAIEVTGASALPEGMVAVEIPASKYARFEHRGATEDLDHTVSYAYATWLSQSPHRHSDGPDLEFYRRQVPVCERRLRDALRDSDHVARGVPSPPVATVMPPAVSGSTPRSVLPSPGTARRTRRDR